MKLIRLALLGLVSIAVLFFDVPLTRASEAPAIIEYVRPLGMGGAFTAVADDHNIFTYNPAGMVQRTGAEVTLLEIAGGVSQDFIDASKFVKDNQTDLTRFDDPTLQKDRRDQLLNDIATNITKLNPRAYVAADIASFVSGPRFFGMPVHGAFGALGVVDASFRLNSGVFVPSINYAINNDVVLPFSLAKRWNAPLLPGRIGVGVTAKYISRRQARQERLSLFSLDTIDSPPLVQGHGFGGDLGLLYQGNDRFNLGLMVRDIGGTRMSFDELPQEKGFPAQAARQSVIRPQTNIGAAVVPKRLLWLMPTNDRWTFAADVRDVFERDQHIFFQNGFNRALGENLYTHLHLGAEFRYWFLRFRGGAYQGYPSLGLGIDIPILKLDYAYYSRELGARAGDNRERNHVVSIAFRFGSGHTEARERINTAKQSTKAGNAMAVPESAPADSSTDAIPK